MAKLKAPKTIYLKELEKEQIEEIAEKKNRERVENGKSELSISTHIHMLLQIGIDKEIKKYLN